MTEQDWLREQARLAYALSQKRPWKVADEPIIRHMLASYSRVSRDLSDQYDARDQRKKSRREHFERTETLNRPAPRTVVWRADD